MLTIHYSININGQPILTITGQDVGLGLCVASIMALAWNTWRVRQPA